MKLKILIYLALSFAVTSNAADKTIAPKKEERKPSSTQLTNCNRDGKSISENLAFSDEVLYLCPTSAALIINGKVVYYHVYLQWNQDGTKQCDYRHEARTDSRADGFTCSVAF